MVSLVYIHGFAGSPKGAKGQLMQKLMTELGLGDRLSIPALDMAPRKAIAQLEQILQDLANPMLIGSSLGGYYATYLAEKYQLKAVLINPLVLPRKQRHEVLNFSDYTPKGLWAIERLTAIVSSAFNNDKTLVDEYIDALTTLKVAPPSEASRYKVLLKKGDEVLDYRLAMAWYKACDVQVDEGGDHGFSDFARYLPQLLAWVGIAPNLWQHIDFSTL